MNIEALQEIQRSMNRIDNLIDQIKDELENWKHDSRMPQYAYEAGVLLAKIAHHLVSLEDDIARR